MNDANENQVATPGLSPESPAAHGKIHCSRTRARTAANRENARRSTGPSDTTATRFNAMKHGLLSMSSTKQWRSLARSRPKPSLKQFAVPKRQQTKPPILTTTKQMAVVRTAAKSLNEREQTSRTRHRRLAPAVPRVHEKMVRSFTQKRNLSLMENGDKQRAPRNRTLTLTASERQHINATLLRPPPAANLTALVDRIVCADSLPLFQSLPRRFVDLLILDPPYNLTKRFGAETFRELSLTEYEEWFEKWFVRLLPLLKPTASLYVCGDWKSSSALHRVLDRHVIVRNRITWEREKGRGAKTNWKNASEDIWFATVSDDYFFNVEAVKMKRRVIAPYREDGRPKDWEDGPDGQFRLTHPSNLWTDLTVPFWSMPENTDHPTQKPEKLIAKLLLASSRESDFVFDPFLGSGTTAAVARKLNRRFLGIEVDESYACLAAKRVELARNDLSIQGYSGGVFWERNSLNLQGKETKTPLDLQPALLEDSLPYHCNEGKSSRRKVKARI